jgi:hypothetical protein
MRQHARDIQHLEPAWQARSDFIIAAPVSSDEEPGLHEQLWTRQVAENLFELCCIPFFVYDVALGDVVETGPVGPRQYVMRRVVKPSGRYVFRAWFGSSSSPHHGVARALVDMGALIEWSSENLLAVDARDASHAQLIANRLAEAEDAGQLIYETGRTSHWGP